MGKASWYSWTNGESVMPAPELTATDTFKVHANNKINARVGHGILFAISSLLPKVIATTPL
jgi:hypothetical protein